ncbi:MAG TPA: peptidylprolyl isomerase [Solirubrobacteraceae bacterium]|nr:peptidylprolyl isomerase [Solirubrobacteraceae bacterium]
MRPGLALASVCLIAALGGCGDDEDAGTGAADTAAPEATERQGESSAAAPGGCREVAAPRPKRDGGQRRPKTRLDPSKTYDVRFETSCGSFTVRLAVKTAPNTSASFVALARRGFFDDTIFHRIVPGFVIQGGDPTATGTGGPGYSTVDKPPENAAYTTGVVAMAKTGAEPRGTAGSQFYVVTGQDAGLPPDYALLGKVTRGIEVTQRIGELGDPASGGAGTPTQPVVIEKATVRER